MNLGYLSKIFLWVNVVCKKYVNLSIAMLRIYLVHLKIRLFTVVSYSNWGIKQNDLYELLE